MKIIKFLNQSNEIKTGVLNFKSADGWNQILDQARIELGKSIKIDGFRPGKIPLNILAKHLSSKEVLNKASQLALPKMYKFFLKQHNDDLKNARFKIYSITKVSFDEIEVRFEWEVLPQIVLGEYKNLAITTPEIKITNDKIDSQIENLRQSYAEYVNKSNSTIEKGDFLTIDYETLFENQLIPSASQKDYQFQLGTQNLLPSAIQAMLYDLKLNQTNTIDFTYQSDYKNQELAGKKVIHRVTLKKIATQILPKLNKLIELLKITKTEKELRDLIKTNLHNQEINQIKPKILKTIKTKILHSSQATISPAYLESEFKMMRQNVIERLKNEKRTLENYLKDNQQTEKDFDLELKALVKRNIEELLMIYQIAKTEKITVSDQELESYYKMLAERFKLSIEEVKKQYQKIILENHLLRIKVEDYLLANNTNFDFKITSAQKN